VTVTITNVTDNVSPRTGNIANSGMTDDTSPTLSGTLSVALTGTQAVHIFRGGGDPPGLQDVGTVTMTDATHWTFTDSGMVMDTLYSYNAYVFDQDGNHSPSSETYTIVIETDSAADVLASNAGTSDGSAGPRGEAAALSDISPDTGSSNADFVTSNGHVTFNGVNAALGAGEQVQINIDGAWHNVTSSTGTTWSFDAVLPDGLYVVQTRVVDQNGKAVSPATVQEVEVSASGTLDLSLSDVLSDASALTGAGAAQQVMVEGGGVVSKVHLAEGVGNGANQWQETGQTTVNGVLYDVYHNAAQGASTAADLLIQHGISVV
jgi:hypothetical protein